MNTVDEHPPVQAHSSLDIISGKLTIWLENEDADFTKLHLWLKGYELPAVGRDKQSYAWILDGLSRIDNSYRREISNRIAIFLTKISPEEYISEKYDDEFLYNLFYLCVGLDNKEILAKPIQKVYKYFENNEQECSRIFSDDNYFDVSDAFREALTANQIDETYVKIWRNILKEKEETFLFTHNIYNGYRGIMYMPQTKNIGEPNFNEIGWALKQMATYLRPEKKRHEKFHGLIERTKEVWKNHPNWNETFLHLSSKYQWQDWAIVRLGCLIQPLKEIDADGMQHYFVWDLYIPFLRELKVPYVPISSSGIIHRIKVSEEAKLFLEKTSRMIESVCLTCPFTSYESVKKAANHSFVELHMFFLSQKEFEFANAIERGRITVLRDLGLPFEKSNIVDIKNSAFDSIKKWLEHLVITLKLFIPSYANFDKV